MHFPVAIPTWRMLNGIVLTLVFSSGLQAQQGYRLGGDAVVVDSQEHWQAWDFPLGTARISVTGEVSPTRWRRHVDATPDIVGNLRLHPPGHLSGVEPEDITLIDAIQAGSNRAAVVNLFDDDMTTFWEPGPLSGRKTADLSSRWWFTVDLGRIVLAEKIVLRFADEDLGDPFKLFEVLTSDGQKPFAAVQGKNLEFSRVYRSLHPNRDERLIEIHLSDLPEAEVRKRVVRFVQVVVHGSDHQRGREVSESEYERLRRETPADTGFIEYAKTLSTGGELPVSKEDWERLDATRRGSVRYFRRERPRLAEFEVWTEGDDVFGGTLRRGGRVVETQKGVVNPQALFDRNVESYVRLDQKILRGARNERRFHEVFVDLGSTFWIDGEWMTLTFRTENIGTLGTFGLDFSDGSREVDGSLAWVRRVAWNSVPSKSAPAGLLLLYRFDFEPVKARFFRLQYAVDRNYPLNTNAHLTDLQLLGKGYQPEVVLTSGLIRLGGQRNLVSLEWDADTPPGTGVALQTRTGSRLDTVFHYFKVVRGDTQEVDETAYNKLKFGKGPIVPEVVASEHWEHWSPPYTDPSGSAISSPSPREFARLRATLLSDDPGKHASLREIRLRFDEPVAGRLIGSVFPREVTELGVERPYKLVVEVDTLAVGFDELLVKPPEGMLLEYGGLFTGSRSEFADNEAGLEGGGAAMSGVKILATGDSLHLSFPAVGPEEGVEILQLSFGGTLFSSGGRLQAMLRRAESGRGSWQRVDEKNVRHSLTLVVESGSRRLFNDVSVGSGIFSPNEDGVNEELTVSFTLMLVGEDESVELRVFDLSGRLVRRVRKAATIGNQAIAWEGRDEAGQRVAPGLYLVCLGVTGAADTNLAQRQAMRTVAVAY